MMSAINVENIPVELKSRAQWVNWRYEINERDPKKKPTKVPYSPKTLTKASSTGPASWGAFSRAVSNLSRTDGIGFVVTAIDPYIGIDLDDCRNPETGELEPWAADIVKQIETYWEVSPSGGGLRGFCIARLPEGRRKKGDVEVYSSGRYLTITGHSLNGSTIQECDGTKLHELLFGKPETIKERPASKSIVSLSDEELFRKMFAAKNGDAVKRLWDGDTSAYPSHSEADLALCAHLYFWTGNSADADRLFRQSGLYREKWDKRHYGGGQTYGQGVLKQVCSGETYTPHRGTPSANLSEPIIINPEWPEPILFGEIVTPEIDCSLLPSWVGAFAQAVSRNTQTPPGMSVMMGLSVTAACIQKRFKVARTPEHIEPLSLFTVTGLPPATRKTAVVNAFSAPVEKWEIEASERMRPERLKIDSIRETLEARIKHLQAQAGKEDVSTRRAEIVKEITDLKAEMPDPMFSPRIFTGDTTPEKLQSLLTEHSERIAVLSDEGGIFAVMAGLYSQGRANIDVFLKGHAGSPVRVDRQSRTAYLDEPALTFGLCIQPEVIRALNKTAFRGNGCLARFLFCIPTNNIGSRTAHGPTIPESVKTAYHNGIFSLLNIPPIFDEHGKETARILQLDIHAAQAWEAFFSFMEASMGPGKELEQIQDWAGKLAGAALRIAGLMAVVDQGAGAHIIGRITMERALNLCELLITHAQAAFDLIEGSDSQHDAKHLFKWLLSKRDTKSFTKSDAYRENSRFRDADRLTQALQVLTARHIVSDATRAKTSGRYSITYDVNPAIYKMEPTQ